MLVLPSGYPDRQIVRPQQLQAGMRGAKATVKGMGVEWSRLLGWSSECKGMYEKGSVLSQNEAGCWRLLYDVAFRLFSGVLSGMSKLMRGEVRSSPIVGCKQ